MVVEDAEEQPAQAMPSPQQRNSPDPAGQATCIPASSNAGSGSAQPSGAAQQSHDPEANAGSSLEADAAVQPESDMQQQQVSSLWGLLQCKSSSDGTFCGSRHCVYCIAWACNEHAQLGMAAATAQHCVSLLVMQQAADDGSARGEGSGDRVHFTHGRRACVGLSGLRCRRQASHSCRNCDPQLTLSIQCRRPV
jgi:hypothetical protein